MRRRKAGISSLGDSGILSCVTEALDIRDRARASIAWKQFRKAAKLFVRHVENSDRGGSKMSGAHATLEDALNAAQPRETIVLRRGTHDIPHLAVHKSLDIVGQPPAMPFKGISGTLRIPAVRVRFSTYEIEHNGQWMAIVLSKSKGPEKNMFIPILSFSKVHDNEDVEKNCFSVVTNGCGTPCTTCSIVAPDLFEKRRWMNAIAGSIQYLRENRVVIRIRNNDFRRESRRCDGDGRTKISGSALRVLGPRGRIRNVAFEIARDGDEKAEFDEENNDDDDDDDEHREVNILTFGEQSRWKVERCCLLADHDGASGVIASGSAKIHVSRSLVKARDSALAFKRFGSGTVYLSYLASAKCAINVTSNVHPYLGVSGVEKTLRSSEDEDARSVDISSCHIRREGWPRTGHATGIFWDRGFRTLLLFCDRPRRDLVNAARAFNEDPSQHEIGLKITDCCVNDFDEGIRVDNGSPAHAYDSDVDVKPRYLVVCIANNRITAASTGVIIDVNTELRSDNEDIVHDILQDNVVEQCRDACMTIQGEHLRPILRRNLFRSSPVGIKFWNYGGSYVADCDFFEIRDHALRLHGASSVVCRRNWFVRVESVARLEHSTTLSLGDCVCVEVKDCLAEVHGGNLSVVSNVVALEEGRRKRQRFADAGFHLVRFDAPSKIFMSGNLVQRPRYDDDDASGTHPPPLVRCFLSGSETLTERSIWNGTVHAIDESNEYVGLSLPELDVDVDDGNNNSATLDDTEYRRWKGLVQSRLFAVQGCRRRGKFTRHGFLLLAAAAVAATSALVFAYSHTRRSSRGAGRTRKL